MYICIWLRELGTSTMDVNSALVNRNKSQKMAEVETGGSRIGPIFRKPSLSLSQMVMLNAVVCGVEFCASAGFTYIPPLLLKAGLSESRMTAVMGFGPLLGIFLVPVLGKASDRCKSSYGRRRPFIFWLSIGCIISLIIIPYAQILTERVLGADSFGKTCGVLFLCFGVVLLDFSTQACLNPCEALLSDASKGTLQQDSIFTVYSVMISLGGCLGYFITAIDWKTSSLGLYFTSQEQSAFSLLLVLFTVTMLATLLIADETPVSLMRSIQSPNNSIDESSQFLTADSLKGQHESGYETSSNSSISESGPAPVKTTFNPIKDVKRTQPLNEVLNSVKPVCNLFTRDCDLPFRSRLLMFLNYRLRSFCGRVIIYMPTGIKQFFNMPLTLKYLVCADFMSWTAIMSFNFFYTDFMGQTVYKGSPNAPEDSDLRDLYDKGVRMGSWGLLFHCIVSAVFAPFVERLANRFGPRQTFTTGMLMFSAAMFVMVMFSNVTTVTLMASLTGFGYACVTIIPFTLVTEYHEDQEVYFFDGVKDGPGIQLRGIAGDMAMLDGAYFFSEVVLSWVMGYIVHYTGTALSYMVTAGFVGLLACVLIQRILTDKQEVISIIREKRQLKVSALPSSPDHHVLQLH